jgi:CubicO group peptidase (beta-lactamase class C family)
MLNGTGLIGQEKSELDSSNLIKLIEFSKETFTDEIMLIHKNKIVCHWKNEKCDSLYFNTASMVKSWTGLVIGILIDKGLIKSENDLVCKYIPDWKDGCKHHVTIKNLLTMSAGFNRRSGAMGILAESDMNQYVVNTELDTLPNIRFAYSNESVQLLGIIIEKLTYKSANEYFHEILFNPLEMDSTFLTNDPTGNSVVFGGASTTIDDASKIGMLMVNCGKYNNKQIISLSWIKKTITPSEKASFYGYLWWLDNNSENKNFAATGDFGQMTIVFPELDLIYLRQQSCNKDKSGNMTWMGPDFLKLISSVIKPN